MPDTWFLLRGLAREAGHWGDFLPAFRAAFPDDDVHTLDLPGAGGMRHVRWPGSVAAAAELVRGEAARVAPARGKTFVLGMSLGGMVTMEWASRYPAELAGMVVIASSAGNLSPPWHRLRPAAWPVLVRANLGKDIDLRERLLIGQLINRLDHWPATHASWTSLARERPMQPRDARGQLLSSIRWRAPESLAIPAVFLVGGRDRFVDPACSVALAARYHARLAVHEAGGHDLTLDEPAWVIAQMKRFRAAQVD